jgi:hypothetical protein
MPEQVPPAGPALLLTAAEVDRRKSILRLLQDALSAQRIASALVGRRTLMLCSEQGEKHFSGYGETVRPCDPQLYVFAGEETQVVTTDGEVYRLPGGHAYPTADLGGAARACATWHQRREALADQQ